MAHDGARERELHRFYQPWIETFHSTALPKISKDQQIPREDGHVPQSSQDRSLTAFAQLGALRLNAKRGIISLMDNKYQYILAEATKSLSLMDDGRYAPGDELWLGNSRIPLGQGMSEDAMNPPKHTAKGPDSVEYTAPALVCEDLSLSPKYNAKRYAGRGVSFYVGVPIVTQRGHTIGVYSVTDDKPRPQGLTVEELRFVVDMGAIVHHHLETIRNERARARGERLIQGIGAFIEGDPIEASLSFDSPDIEKEAENPLDNVEHHRQHQRPKLADKRESSSTFKGMTIQDANSWARDQHSAQEDEAPQSPISAGPQRRQFPHMMQDPKESTKDPYAATQKPKSQHALVFDRASKILRKCLGSDGVAFLDASAANLSKGTARRGSQKSKSTIVQHSRVKDTRSSKGPQNSRSESQASEHEVSATQDTVDDPGDSSPTEQPCEIIALAVKDLNSDTAIALSEYGLRKLVRRHPQGKCYALDAQGRLVMNEDSASETVYTEDNTEGDGLKSREDDVQHKRKLIKKNPLLGALPKARTVVFLPLWDFANQRWNAAAVIWSADPAKLMNVQQDFAYLRAFANSIMNEVARLSLSVSDAAKATFLANISHELRSPLHGILGSIEFLHDTALDDFQSGMVISVETCGKTLLDTVNHVLDFAKINNLSKQNGKYKGAMSAVPSTHSPLTGTFDLATVVEEGVEAVYAGQVFRTADKDALEGRGPSMSSHDKAALTRQNKKDRIAQGQADTLSMEASAVRLTLNIEECDNWAVTSQPGAIRRIVMNLLGNALKYTSRGSINVGLEVDNTRPQGSEAGLLHACLSVTDTGKGMSEDFVRNHAFTAFSQEDSLAAGTGLGLSIVRSIVDSLGGKITLRSQKDLGTEVKIWLSLTSNEAEGREEKTILQQMQERTGGMSVCLLAPDLPEHKAGPGPTLREMPTVEQSAKDLLEKWYSVKMVTAPSMDNIKDADFFVYAEPPPIEYLLHRHGEHAADREIPVIILCQNAFEASSLRANGIHHLTDIGRIIEVIAQPVGPQKLAKALHRCMQRTKKLEDDPREAMSSENVGVHVRVTDDYKSPPPHDRKTGQPIKPVRKESKDTRANGTGQAEPKEPKNAEAKGDSHTKEKESQDKKEDSQKGESSGKQELVLPERSLSPSQKPQPDVDDNLPSVLVVDDNQIYLRLMATFVRKIRHPYESAMDGLQALEAYKRSHAGASNRGSKRFQYILMDINMPNMDGVNATKEIRKYEKANKIEPPAQIFALTGLGPPSQSWIEEIGFDRFLSKPIKFKELKQLLS